VGILRLSLGLAVTASCGRFGFHDVPDSGAPSPDGAIPNSDGTTPPAVTPLRCGSPTRVQLGNVQAIATAAIDAGFAVFTGVGGDQNVHGWMYTVDASGNLVAAAKNVTIGTSETKTFGAGGMGSELGVAFAYGSPATGTQMTALDTNLATIGSAQHAGEIPVTAPIAGDVLVTINGNVTGRLVSPNGSDASSAKTIASSAEAPSDVSIVPAGSGYAVAYHVSMPPPNHTRIVLLDSNLAIVGGPTTIGDLVDDAYLPRAAWADASQTLLVAYHEKNAVGGDDVWFQLLSATLSPITPPTLIGPSSTNAQVTTDGTAFWMVWLDNSTNPSLLAGARVDATGAIAPRAIVRSGGSPGPWTTVVRDGQPVLVWNEKNGTGPDLYFDPMCN
jgi:hypothetical protein